MSHRTPYRRRAALVLGALVVGMLPAVALAPPASASEGCLADDPIIPILLDLSGCDDTTPPETTITRSAPQPNGATYIRTDSISFEFAGSYTDEDTGTLEYKCRLDEAAWETCTSPKTYTDLADSKAGYRFQVKAIDATDAAVVWSDSTNIFSPVTEPDPTDEDKTPATQTFKVDTTPPNTFIFNEPYDAIRPELPMVTNRNISLRLDSSESATDVLRFVCALDGVSVPCKQGDTRLTKLKPGDRRFTAAAIDLAGNRDPSRDVTRFAVPRNLVAPARSGWRRVKGGQSYFAGDYLEARKVGATLVTKRATMRELRLIAPAGPNLGVIDIQIGNGIRRKINLKAARYERFKVYVIRDEYAPRVSGRITIRARALPGHKVARVDALLAH
ncbi:MAG: hypothetical protein Q8O61_18360 [Nocardioides sp.]|nr:hypothetical protein [Nocardioides sp.]